MNDELLNKKDNTLEYDEDTVHSVDITPEMRMPNDRVLLHENVDDLQVTGDADKGKIGKSYWNY